MLKPVQLKRILQWQPTDTLDWELIFIDDSCVTYLGIALHGTQPGIHKFPHLLCVTMSETFAVLEQMPSSHTTTTPLATFPAELMQLCPQKNSTCKGFACSSHPRPGRTTWHGSFLSHMVLHCMLLCNWGASQYNLWILFRLVLASIQDPRRPLQAQRLLEKVASQWSSSSITWQYMLW